LLQTEPKNELEKREVFYTLQTAIESTVDLIVMLIKDLGIPVSDDETNIMEYIKQRKLNNQLGEDLKKANGMRNILVHRYNKVEEDIIIGAIEKAKRLLFDWIKILEGILDEITEAES